MKSSKLEKALLFGLLVMCASCGKPSQTPESNAGITETSATAKEDLRGTPGEEIVVMKLIPAAQDAKPVELKSDGSVRVDGRLIAAIKGDEVTSAGGGSMPGFKVEGNDLTGEGGLKLTVSDDGTITTSKDGKTQVLGRIAPSGRAKRTALVLAALYLTIRAEKNK